MRLDTGPHGDEWTRFRFAGRLDGREFRRFVVDRTDCLQLGCRDMAVGDCALECEVSGPPALVDAFELACLLGPDAALVLEAERGPARAAAKLGHGR